MRAYAIGALWFFRLVGDDCFDVAGTGLLR
jgi:hypothetical protein